MGGKTKRKLTDWNKFVMKVKAENPEKKFSDVLKMAGKMKRQGVKVGEYINNKTAKVVKKITKSAKSVLKNARKTGKKLLKKSKKMKRKTAKKKN
uniref:Uncharacterized protein n=1 Tax=viral metagenome TaxID=1070528 RepID=A0A6C0KZJ9_9ZZZZ|tara:strand:- start:380 stop:664 length:285 start_codon:yes stop_codon:yes gene_type:complete